MKITSMPENYQGAFDKIIYELDEINPEEIIEVTILGNSTIDILGTKKYRGHNNYAVNIANYVQRTVDVLPMYQSRCAIYTPANRDTMARIAVGGTLSDYRIYTAGIKKAGQLEVLSDAPEEMNIRPGEIDEFSVVTKDGHPFIMHGSLKQEGGLLETAFRLRTMGTGRMKAVVINMADVEEWVSQYGELGNIDKYSSLIVYLESPEENIFRPIRTYGLMHENINTTRLCWVNQYGALDYYTFNNVENTKISASKNKMYTQYGYKTYGVEAHKIHSLKSDYENSRIIEWLAGVITSPKVWISRGQEFIPVDVITDEAGIKKNEPHTLDVIIREMQKTHSRFL